MESDHENEGSNHSVAHPEVTVGEGEGDLTLGRNSGSSSLSFSSSSSDFSFDEDFFLIDENNLSKSNTSNTSPPNSGDDPELPSKDGEKKFLSDSSSKSREAAMPELELNLQNELATQSPPAQVMERPEDATPYRIPSSVFARSKSTTPMEWSVASNESLFSIHMGNNSFSRDHVFLMGRSGELGKSGELIFSNSSSPAIGTSLPEKRSSDLEEDLAVTEAAAETMREVLRAAAEDHNNEKTQPVGIHRSSSISRHSDGSGTSIRSFAFPILTGEGGKSGSVKTQLQQIEKQQSQPKTPAVAPTNACETKWFSCFSCCCYCC